MIKNVGFIGAGVMGKSMIRNLMKKVSGNSLFKNKVKS